MSQSSGLRDLAKILLLVGGIIALVGGLLGLLAGFVSAGPLLAVIVGMVSLAFFTRLSSRRVDVVLLVLGLTLAVITGGMPSVGGILVSAAAIMALLVRYTGV